MWCDGGGGGVVRGGVVWSVAAGCQDEALFFHFIFFFFTKSKIVKAIKSNINKSNFNYLLTAIRFNLNKPSS